MQPHSITFRSSQTKLTGYSMSVSYYTSHDMQLLGATITYLGQEIVASGRQRLVSVALQ